jgi:hypothetical protein
MNGVTPKVKSCLVLVAEEEERAHHHRRCSEGKATMKREVDKGFKGKIEVESEEVLRMQTILATMVKTMPSPKAFLHHEDKDRMQSLVRPTSNFVRV